MGQATDSVLRVYDPAECDAQGVPLDWEFCRRCSGTGERRYDWKGADITTEGDDDLECAFCDGAGSLRAAALIEMAWQGDRFDPAGVRRTARIERGTVQIVAPRCGGCGHPMGEALWEDPMPARPRGEDVQRSALMMAERDGPDEATNYFMGMRCFSACDAGCQHAGPVEWSIQPDSPSWDVAPADATVAQLLSAEGASVRASWRVVDVRTLGWAHDLRPEKLAVLCLRCRAEGRRA